MAPIRVQLIIVSSCCQDKHNKIPSCFLPIEKHFRRFLVYSIFSKYWLLEAHQFSMEKYFCLQDNCQCVFENTTTFYL